MVLRHVACCVLLAFCLTIPATLCAEPRAGETWQEPATGMIFVWVPGGVIKPAFGPIARDPYYGDDDPRSVPRISGFWLGKFEVTQGQWRKIMQGNPSAFQKGDAYPVESVFFQRYLIHIEAERRRRCHISSAKHRRMGVCGSFRWWA